MADRVGQQLGNYHLVRLLGRGGQAEVYLGEHRYLKSFAALKVLHASLDDTHAEQFLAEAQTLARLVHPAIVRVLDFIVEQGTPVLIMDYSPAGTMRERYPPGTRLPLATIVSAVSQVASALHYAHTHHVIHRDVKPENLLLGQRDEVLLSDFGLAVFAPSPELLSTQAMAGTLPYMAPEQLQGHPCFASDQYSLALVAYEWLTGTRPFRGSQWQLIQQQLYAPPPSMRERNPAVPAEVEAVVRRALAKDPRERYMSVQDFARVLARASQVVLSPREDAAGAPLPLFQSVESLDELGETSDHSTLPRPSLVPLERAEETERLRTPRVPSQEHHGKTEQVASRSKDVNRQRLLAKVRAFWITGVLEHSLHGAALIALGLREQPDAVANPWHLVLESPGEPESALPPGTSIVQAYDEAVGELLILGEPGSGKTTLLLELARTLLVRAEQDERHPLPVIFNLSSWANKKQPLAAWLIEELTTKYQVPRKLGLAWVATDQILPLLDGLDEVAPAARAACVETINVYRLTHGLVPTVVCSRSAEYLAESVQVLLRKAVVVQPLTVQQIEDYLASAEGALAPVRAALREDWALRELATTPLMLSVLTLAYRDTSAEDLLVAATPQVRRRHIFEHYVERMLSRRGAFRCSSREQARCWLTFIAARMRADHQTTFYLEQLQPNWLPEQQSRLLYRLSSGLLAGLLAGSSLGLSWRFGFGLPNELLGGVLVGVLGLLFELTGRMARVSAGAVPTWSWRKARRKTVSGLLGGLLVGLPYGLSSSGPGGGLFWGLFGALFWALVGLLSGLSANQLDERIRLLPNQGIWQAARNGLLLGGLGFGVGFGLSCWRGFGLMSGLLGGLGFGLMSGLAGGLVGFAQVELGGGLVFLQHFALRVFLWCTGCLPWNLVAFLDEAAERLLLRKVGGGYIFVHRLLLEYFASLDTRSGAAASGPPLQSAVEPHRPGPS